MAPSVDYASVCRSLRCLLIAPSVHARGEYLACINCRRATMRSLALACLALGMSASPVRAEFITVNAFNNSTPATVSFNDGSGHSGTDNTLLTQFNITYSPGAGTPFTFSTFSVDLFHTVSSGQTYAVDPRGDVATAFANGSRIASIYQMFGVQDLTNNPDQAAAVQIAI